MLSTLFLALAVQQPVRVTPLAEHLYLIQTGRGNLVASAGPEGAVLIGAVDSLSTRAIAESLSARTTSPRRTVVAMLGEAGRGQADGGWDRLGVLVIMQEQARGHTQDAGGLLRPRGAFSQFLSLDFNGESMHIVHQPAGYSDGDALVHFEEHDVIYLGESYPGDGYPKIDSVWGGTVDGLLQTIAPWTRGTANRIVGARGDVARPADVLAFRDMVVAVRDRIRTMKAAGQTVAQVLAARVTAPYDARFGRGLVTADDFVRMVYRVVR